MADEAGVLWPCSACLRSSESCNRAEYATLRKRIVSGWERRAISDLSLKLTLWRRARRYNEQVN
jgi:hypothetical protein